MNIVVCMKITPDASDIAVHRDGTISLERAELKISGFDLLALESGVRLAEENPDSAVTVLSAGPAAIDHSRLRKDILSRGADALCLVADDHLQNADTAQTARTLAAAIRQLGGVDLILFGEGSADLYFQQVGLQVGERLEMPSLNAISSIQMGDGCLRVERSLEDEIEVLEVPLPAALSVTTDITAPRLPTMKEILKAGKKPVTVWSLSDLGIQAEGGRRIETVSTRAPHQVERRRILITGTPQEAAKALIGHLSREGFI